MPEPVPLRTGREQASVRFGPMTGPLGDVPPPEQLMTVTRDDRAGPVLVVHGEVDLSTGGRLRDAVSTVLQQAPGGP